MHEFPLQPTKVQRPPLRRETLRRERLLDWLKVKIHHRIVLVTAEAGYGKTTLLADFARHHRRPTMWYRLDDEDRNWVSFVHYLVAAGREIEPDFGIATKGLLAELGVTTGPSRDTIVATFIRDLRALGARAATLIIDDYHLVDDVPDVRVVVRELVNRAPERLTLVFASRQLPSVPLARLRTLGEVAELTAADLRFDVGETERLFRDTYKRPLEPDVLADLADRTEGWAASLEMVNAALRDRSPGEIRAFIRGMTGAHGELYDYLAEEVVGDLDDETQRFLMTTSLLQAVDPTLAEVVGGFSGQQSRELIARTERLGLLSTRGTARRGARRYHPLVREFLEARLRRTFGDDAARDLHRAVARHAGDSDWRLAAYHFAAADDLTDLGIAVQAAVPTIMGSGDFALAESYVQRAGTDNAAYDLLVSRMDLHRGRTDSALTHAELAVDTAMSMNDGQLIDQGLSNLVTALFMTGQLESAREVAQTLRARTTSSVLRDISDGIVALMEGSLDGDLNEIHSMLVPMALEQERRGLWHYAGVTWLNIADLERARGQSDAALEAATKAIDALLATSSGLEVESARTTKSWALAHEGRWDESLAEMALAESTPFDAVRAEVLVDIASIHAAYGSRSVAETYLDQAQGARLLSEVVLDVVRLTDAELAMRGNDYGRASACLEAIATDRPHPCFGFTVRVGLTRAMLALATGSPDAERDSAAVIHLAAMQGSRLYLAPARLLRGALLGGESIEAAIATAVTENSSALSMVAEPLVARLGTLTEDSRRAIELEATRRPTRWREPLRRGVNSPDPIARFAAASILDKVGEVEDIKLLRAASRSLRAFVGGPSLGRGLARRLAAPVFIDDQGRLLIRVGSESIHGSDVRRKVLALLCFLLSRGNMSATRDQVLEALWPELEPEVAGNSLNQTIYFLRRVFEPSFTEDLTPGYVHHNSDLVWLDSELVTSRSGMSKIAIKSAESDPTPENIGALSSTYMGRFALDFAYEEWAVAYRESMHAAYLEIIEKAVGSDTTSGAFDRAIRLARRAMDIDPEAEEIELSLLKLYRRTGAHAAAAEQYLHYASVLKNDLGIEPPPLESL